MFGLGLFGVGASWVYISIHEFGNTPAVVAGIITFLFVFILASLIGLTGAVFRRFFTHHLLHTAIAFPALWVLQEWLRSWIFSGFPWLLLGYSQINSPLAGYIPVLGEYGVSFLVTLISALLFLTSHVGKRFGYCLLVMLVILSGGASLRQVNWTQPASDKWYSAALIQGNVPQEMKWNADYLDKTLRTYLTMTRTVWDKDIIVWPESAIPTAYQYAIDFINELGQEAKRTNTALIIGIPVEQQNPGDANSYFYNSLMVLGKGEGTYYKRHLVPFGEYLPLKKWLHGLIGFFNIPMSDFIPGEMPQPNLRVLGLAVAPFICYEIAYGNVVRQNLPAAELLVITSNDSWFGNSLAPWQHLEIGQFRSLQTGRYQLFASNSGITAIIDPQGRIVDRIPQFIEAVLIGKVQARTGVTPWVKWGSAPVILFILLIVAIIYIKNRFKMRK